MTSLNRCIKFVMKCASSYILLILGLSINDTHGQESNVTLVGRWANGPCYAVTVDSNLCYFGNGGYLQILDFSDNANPVELSKLVLPSAIYGITIDLDYAYIANFYAGLQIIDISNTSSPSIIGSFDTGSETYAHAYSVAVKGNYAFVAFGYAGLRIIDISNPSNPIEINFITTRDITKDVVVNGDFAYVADGRSGLRIIDISNPATPFEIGFFDTAWDAWAVEVIDTLAYVTDGHDGLRILNIANPANPFEVGFFDTGYEARNITIKDHFAYIVDGRDGLRIIDITDPVNTKETGFYDTDGYALDIAVHDNYAYVADQVAGLRIVNITDRSSPSERGFISTGGSTLDVEKKSSYAYVADYDHGLKIVDITDIKNPFTISSFNTGTHTEEIELRDNYAFVVDSYDGLRIIDVSDPFNPNETGYFDSYNIYPKAVAIEGSYAYLANYYSGLQIVDISNPSSPIELGSLDTGNNVEDIVVRDSLVYIVYYQSGLRIIDVSNPINPIEIGSFHSGYNMTGIDISGDYAYLTASKDGLLIVDISFPENTFLTGRLNTNSFAYDVTLFDNYAYVADFYGGLSVIDICNPFNPLEVGYYNTGGMASAVSVCDSNIYVADEIDGFYIFRNKIQRPVAKFELSQTEIIWGDSILADASSSYDPDSDEIYFKWSGFADIRPFDDSQKAWIKPWSSGNNWINLDVSDGLVHSDTSKIVMVQPKLDNINIIYSFIDSAWARSNFYFQGDTLLVPLFPKYSTRIYNVTAQSIDPVSDLAIPNAIRIHAFRNNNLYVGLIGETSGFWGPGPFSIYSVTEQWQITPLLENYLPGSLDVNDIIFLDNDTILTYDQYSVYQLSINNPSVPEILAQTNYLSPQNIFDVYIVENYIYVGISEWPSYTIDVLEKSSLNYVITLNVSPDLKNFNVTDTLMFIGFRDSLKIYSISSPLNPKNLTKIEIPDELGWNLPYPVNYYGNYVQKNLLTVKRWAGVQIYDISVPSEPQPFASWYGVSGYKGGIGMGLKYINGNYYMFDDFDAYPNLNNDYSGINRIIFNSTSVKETVKNNRIITFNLLQNYPNPFNPITTIEFTLSKHDYVSLKIYNILGKKVATLVSGKLNPGKHIYRFNASHLASGLYYYQLVAGDYIERRWF